MRSKGGRSWSSQSLRAWLPSSWTALSWLTASSGSTRWATSLRSTPVIETYIDGSSDRRYQFNFGSREYYGMDRLQNIANSTFYEDFAAWVEAQDAAGHFPEVPEGMHPEQLTVLSSGYMFDESMQNARYQIQLELIYHKEA